MPENPPAPVSDATLAAAPEFVIDGQWDDKEWRAIAARPSNTWTEAEKYVWAGGPRPHPWGRAGFSAERPDGLKVTFPSKDAHDKHMAAAAEKQAKGEAGATNALSAINAGLAAQADAPQQPVAPASNPVQASYMLQGASPNGAVVG